MSDKVKTALLRQTVKVRHENRNENGPARDSRCRKHRRCRDTSFSSRMPRSSHPDCRVIMKEWFGAEGFEMLAKTGMKWAGWKFYSQVYLIRLPSGETSGGRRPRSDDRAGY